MNDAVLLLGGNLGYRVANLTKARKLLESYLGRTVKASALYESAAWGFSDDRDFLNQVLVFEVKCSADKLLVIMQAVENEMGRTRNGQGYQARTMDIDLLFYNDEIINTSQLTVPHPRLHQRLFTLMPLAEILPDRIHPSLDLSCQQLLEQCPDKLPVWKLAENKGNAPDF